MTAAINLFIPYFILYNLEFIYFILIFILDIFLASIDYRL